MVFYLPNIETRWGIVILFYVVLAEIPFFRIYLQGLRILGSPEFIEMPQRQRPGLFLQFPFFKSLRHCDGFVMMGNVTLFINMFNMINYHLLGSVILRKTLGDCLSRCIQNLFLGLLRLGFLVLLVFFEVALNVSLVFILSYGYVGPGARFKLVAIEQRL